MPSLGKFIREKVIFKYRIKGKNNKIFFKENGKLKPVKHRIRGLKIHIIGNDNTIILEKPLSFQNCKMTLTSNNADIQIKSSSRKFFDSSLSIGGNNNKVEIGKNLSTIGLSVYVGGTNSSFKIGDNCIISDNVTVMNHDGHKIFDKTTQEHINTTPYHLEIGDHVWIGRKVTINKKAKIPSGCIVGMNSYVLHPFEKENSIIAGYPARIIKENIYWEF